MFVKDRADAIAHPVVTDHLERDLGCFLEVVRGARRDRPEDEFRMDQQRLGRKLLLPIFRTTARISQILSAKRSLTLEMARKPHFGFGIPLDSLVVEKERRAPRPTRRRKPQGKQKHRQRRAA